MSIVRIIKLILKFTIFFPIYVYRRFLIRYQELQNRVNELQNRVNELEIYREILSSDMPSFRKYYNMFVENRTLQSKNMDRDIPEEDLLAIKGLARFIPYEVEGLTLERIGRSHGDGGYLIPLEAVLDTDVCISGGVANDISFEERLIDIKSQDILCFDPTVAALPVMDRKKEQHFQFFQYGLSSENMRKSKDLEWEVITFNEVFMKFELDNGKKNVGIKIDIECSEFDFLEEFDETLLRYVSYFVIEFHYLTERKILMNAAKILEKFSKHLTLVHVHVNNAFLNMSFLEKYDIFCAPLMECTFINNKFVNGRKKSLKSSIEHPLDVANHSLYPPMSSNYAKKIPQILDQLT